MRGTLMGVTKGPPTSNPIVGGEVNGEEQQIGGQSWASLNESCFGLEFLCNCFSIALLSFSTALCCISIFVVLLCARTVFLVR